MKSRPINRALGALVRLLPLTALACSAADGTYPEGDFDEVATDSEALATDLLLTNTWASPGTVDVCFYSDDPEGWTSHHELRADQTMEALEETWETVTGLTFTRITCQAPGPIAALKINLSVLFGAGENALGGTCPPGRGTTCMMTAPEFATDFGYMRSIMHEVGHALRMMHEHQRSVPGPNGTLVHEVPLDPVHQAAWLLNPSDGNLMPLPYYGMTEYNKCSIMNYGQGPWGCTNSVNLNRDTFEELTLTSLDRLGAEILYPTGETLPLGCHKGCFIGGDGGVVLRSDGEVRDAWTARGAYAWTANGNLTWEGTFVAPTHPVGHPGSRYIAYFGKTKYRAAYPNIEGGGYAESDNSKWTAIALSML